MEVEARNLDKKVCVAGGRGGSLLPQELRRLEWCDGGQGGTEVWHSRRLSLNLTIGFCGIDRTSWGNQIRSWSSSARVMGNGTWHTDLRCENAGIGWGGVRESPGAYDYQGLEHREKEPTLGRERMAAPHTQSHSSLEALPFFTFRWSRTTWTPRGSASLFPFSISVGETPAHTFRWGACLLSYWMGAERPGRDLFLPGAYLLFFIYIHPPPPRCDAQTMTVMVHMISLVPSTPAWPSCKQPRWVLALLRGEEGRAASFSFGWCSQSSLP